MQFFAIFSAFITFLNYVRAADQAGIKLYSTRYDNLNIDTILNSDRLVTNYVDCLLSRKPCPPEGKDLKRILPEALRTKCARCSINQKEGALRVITKLYYSYPKHYNDLREKWDTTGEYHRRFEEYLHDKQFNVISTNKDPVAPPYKHVQRIPASNNNRGRPTLPITVRPPVTNTPSQVVRTNPPISLTRITSTTEVQTPRPARNPVVGLSALPSAIFINQVPQQQPQQSRPQQNTFDVANRFADEVIDEYDTSVPLASIGTSSSNQPQSTFISLPALTQSPTAPSTPRTTQSTLKSTPIQFVTYSQPNQLNIIDKFFIPPQQTYQPTNNRPILGLIQSLGNKISNTADFIADMLRGTVKVIKAFKHIA